MFGLNNYLGKGKCYDDSNESVVDKIKDETGGVAIKEFAGSKPKMHSFSVDDSSEHKKGNGVNKNVVITISENE